jgi:hypothetical protein
MAVAVARLDLRDAFDLQKNGLCTPKTTGAQGNGLGGMLHR